MWRYLHIKNALDFMFVTCLAFSIFARCLCVAWRFSLYGQLHSCSVSSSTCTATATVAPHLESCQSICSFPCIDCFTGWVWIGCASKQGRDVYLHCNSGLSKFVSVLVNEVASRRLYLVDTYVEHSPHTEILARATLLYRYVVDIHMSLALDTATTPCMVQKH